MNLSRPFSWVILTVLMGLLAACAPATRVTLLPQANGAPSAVTVRSALGEQVLNQPYQVADVSRRGAISRDTSSAQQVRQAYPRLVDLQSAPPERFTLEFERGTSQLTAESQALITQVIARALARAGGEIVVTGHTDRLGTVEANDQLSLERAQMIRAQLVGAGFDPARIEAVGRGEREPLVSTEDEVTEPRNRRAEVVVR